MKRGATGPFSPYPIMGTDDPTSNKRLRSEPPPLFPHQAAFEKSSNSSGRPIGYPYLPHPHYPLGGVNPRPHRNNDTQAPRLEEAGSSIPIAHPRPQRLAARTRWWRSPPPAPGAHVYTQSIFNADQSILGPQAYPSNHSNSHPDPGKQVRFSSPVAVNRPPTPASRLPPSIVNPSEKLIRRPLGSLPGLIDSPTNTRANTSASPYPFTRRSSAKEDVQVKPRAISSTIKGQSASILLPSFPDTSSSEDSRLQKAQEKVNKLNGRAFKANQDLQAARRELNAMSNNGEIENLRRELADAREQLNRLEKDHVDNMTQMVSRHNQHTEMVRREHKEEINRKNEKIKTLERKVRMLESDVRELTYKATDKATFTRPPKSHFLHSFSTPQGTTTTVINDDDFWGIPHGQQRQCVPSVRRSRAGRTLKCVEPTPSTPGQARSKSQAKPTEYKHRDMNLPEQKKIQYPLGRCLDLTVGNETKYDQAEVDWAEKNLFRLESKSFENDVKSYQDEEDDTRGFALFDSLPDYCDRDIDDDIGPEEGDEVLVNGVLMTYHVHSEPEKVSRPGTAQMSCTEDNVKQEDESCDAIEEDALGIAEWDGFGEQEWDGFGVQDWDGLGEVEWDGFGEKDLEGYGVADDDGFREEDLERYGCEDDEGFVVEEDDGFRVEEDDGLFVC